MRIAVYLDRQRLELIDDQGVAVASYAVSTARNGAGERYGSYCTPRGLHVVRAKVGAGCAPNTVLVRRRPTGETWTPQLAREHPGRDWMLTRILWLSGRESGFNRGGVVDSLRRKIYIHGAGDDRSLGEPSSHGCVRMRNADVIDLYDRVNVGTAVDIVKDSALPFTVRIVRWEAERARLRSLRTQVFVVEQRVPAELEFDEDDPVCRHALALEPNGQAIGCARLLGDASIGRVAVLSAWRGRGVGGAMLARLMDVARYACFERVSLNARSDTQAFYARLGFVACGEEYVEVGIRHQRMERAL
ncbi:MAG TPA: GNAT family N-acetyltransferase [Casimicrobiaceae bacterium]|nr:GNAT family N-acetyltransferase [Casimicrobiaceae bacterium]